MLASSLPPSLLGQEQPGHPGSVTQAHLPTWVMSWGWINVLALGEPVGDLSAHAAMLVSRRWQRALGVQGRDGWDITRALAAVKAQAKLDGQAQSQRAAAAVEERVAQARGLRASIGLGQG
jgi:hypothetical protein